MSAFKTAIHGSLGDSVRFLMILLVIGGLTLLASNLIVAQLFSFTSIESRGDITKINVGVYWDENCSSPVSSIDWGEIEPGSVKSVSLFVRNEGNVAAGLFVGTDNWSPSSASEFMSLTWDYTGQTLDPFETILVTLTLQVSPSVTGIKGFSFNIIIGVTA